MVAIGGWLIPEAAAGDDPDTLAALARTCGSSGPVATATAPGSACVARGGSVDWDADSGVLATICGRAHWRDSDLAGTGAAYGDATALLGAYRRFGSDLVDQLQGEFTLAVIDPARTRVIAAADRLARQPLYYARAGSGVVFASTATAVANHPLVNTELSPQGVFDYLYFHMIPAPGTIYRTIAKLPAANRVEYRDGSLEASRYWIPTFREDHDASRESLAAEVRGAIRDAVGQHTGPGQVGAFLSGGLDSSTVAGMLAERQGAETESFSIGFHAEGYDEIPFARATARHFGMQSHEYYVTPRDVGDSLEHIARAYDEPFGNSSALPAYFCARAAAQAGITTLLAGDGGDELFAGNTRYTKQQLFERYHQLPGALRRTVLEPALGTGLGGLPGARKLRSYVEQANTPLPDRMQSYNFMHRIPPEAIFSQAFLEQVDTSSPLRRLREIYNAPAEPTTALNRMMYLDWQITLADSDLRKVTRMCEVAGVEAVFPMLDDAVVDVSTRIPSDWKLPRGRLRGFYKDAFRDWLPAGTLGKKKHGFGLPFGVWLRTEPDLRAVASDGIANLHAQGWFAPGFLDSVLDERLAEHAAYYGDLAWVLAVLGLWEQKGSDTASRSDVAEAPDSTGVGT